MKHTIKQLMGIPAITVSLLVMGCSAMLPHGHDRVTSPWHNFDEAMQAYNAVMPYQSHSADLRELGFEPDANRNVRILNHLEVLDRFLPNKVLTRDDLPFGMQECIAVGEACRAYEVNQRVSHKKRHGSFLSDFFNFSRKVEITGWEFNAVIVLNEDLVVYKLWSGKPNIQEHKESRNPLGPLQGVGPNIVTPNI